MCRCNRDTHSCEYFSIYIVVALVTFLLLWLNTKATVTYRRKGLRKLIISEEQVSITSQRSMAAGIHGDWSSNLRAHVFLVCFGLVWFGLGFSDKVWLYSSGCPRTHYVEQDGRRLIKIHLPLPLKCWNESPVIPWPSESPQLKPQGRSKDEEMGMDFKGTPPVTYIIHQVFIS